MQHEKGHGGDTNISPLVLHHGNGASLLAHFKFKMSIPRMWGYFEPQNAWERRMMNFMHYSFYKWTVFLPLFLLAGYYMLDVQSAVKNWSAPVSTRCSWRPGLLWRLEILPQSLNIELVILAFICLANNCVWFSL